MNQDIFEKAAAIQYEIKELTKVIKEGKVFDASFRLEPWRMYTTFGRQPQDGTALQGCTNLAEEANEKALGYLKERVAALQAEFDLL